MDANINIELLPFNLEEITFIETYAYYDRPCLFACKDLKGQIYIGLLVSCEDDSDIWLYSPISEEEFSGLKQQKIDLRSVFTKIDGSDRAIVKAVKTKNTELVKYINIISASDIKDDYLPDSNVFI